MHRLVTGAAMLFDLFIVVVLVGVLAHAGSGFIESTHRHRHA